MTKSKTIAGTAEELTARARQLVPAIRARADEAERLRRLPEDTVNELRAAGLQRVLQPAAYGGAEAHFAGVVDVVGIIAGACASTGWVLAQYTIHNFMVAQFPAEAQQDMWGENPDAFVCGVLIPGLGQVYSGRLISGLLWFLAASFGYSAVQVPGFLIHCLSVWSAYRGASSGRYRG